MFPSKKNIECTPSSAANGTKPCATLSQNDCRISCRLPCWADRLIIFRLLLRISVLPDRHQQNKVCLSGFSTILRIGCISSYS